MVLTIQTMVLTMVPIQLTMDQTLLTTVPTQVLHTQVVQVVMQVRPKAGGGTVILVTGTKPLPGSLTLAAAAGTSGAGTATAGTVVTVYNIAATDTDPGS